MAVSFDRVTITGIEYALFPADSGSYVATYAPGVNGVSAVAATATTAGTATVRWTGNLPGTAEVAYGTSPSALSRTTIIAEKISMSDPTIKRRISSYSRHKGDWIRGGRGGPPRVQPKNRICCQGGSTLLSRISSRRGFSWRAIERAPIR